MDEHSPSGMQRSARWEQDYAEWEPALGAILTVDPQQVPELDVNKGPLSGLAVGIKDVVDVAGLPTRNGSRVHDGTEPATTDAVAVASLRRAGATILCKTATTEFAFIDPVPTKNPFDASRTPGGSSSGSGAAVGAGLLDLAIGTQTAGSLCRPAAYCGAVGFKPSFGVIPTKGVTPLSPSFDTVGFVARSVPIAALAFAACGGKDSGDVDVSRLKIGMPPIDPNAPMSDEAMRALDEAADAFRSAGAKVEPVSSDIELAEIVANHRVVMLYQAASLHGKHLESGLLQPRFAEGVAAGLKINREDADTARQALQSATLRFWRNMIDCDVLLTPPVPSVAPDREGGTGYQNMLTPWTVFGGPLLCLPWGTDAQGLPLSVMLAAAPQKDGVVLGAGKALSNLAPALKRPSPA